MKKRFTPLGNGRGTWVQWLVGLVIVWLLFLRGRNTSATPKQTILKVLQGSGVSPQTSEYWAAVSNHETGKWTSNLYLKYHNMFGMKQPYKRATLSIGPAKITENGNPFASFANDTDSVNDLVLYMKEFNYPLHFDSVDALVAFMKSKGYFADTIERYLKSVKARL